MCTIHVGLESLCVSVCLSVCVCVCAPDREKANQRLHTAFRFMFCTRRSFFATCIYVRGYAEKYAETRLQQREARETSVIEMRKSK